MNLTIDLTLSRKQDIRKAVAPLVDMAAERLYDHHSKGMFYSTITQLYPQHLHVFTQALEEAEAEGKVNPEVIMGVVFVHAIRNVAAQEGIQLRLGKPKANEAVAMANETVAIEGEDEAGEAAEGSREEVQEELEDENLVRSQTTNVAGVGVSAKQLWPAVLNELQSRTSKANYEMWLRNCEVLGFQGDVVIVGVPSVFARDWITDRLLAPIQSALRELMRKEVRVRCEVQGRRGSRR